MQITSKSSLPIRVLTGLCALVIALGFTSGSVLAHDDHPDKNLPAHEQPCPHEPPTGGHSASQVRQPIRLQI